MNPFDLTIIKIPWLPVAGKPRNFPSLGFPWLTPRHGTSAGDGHLQQWAKGGGTGGLCCLPRVAWVRKKNTHRIHGNGTLTCINACFF